MILWLRRTRPGLKLRRHGYIEEGCNLLRNVRAKGKVWHGDRRRDKEPLIHRKRRGMTSPISALCCIVQIILVLYYITLYYFIFPDDSDLLINTVQHDGMRITRTMVSLDIFKLFGSSFSFVWLFLLWAPSGHPRCYVVAPILRYFFLS